MFGSTGDGRMSPGGRSTWRWRRRERPHQVRDTSTKAAWEGPNFNPQFEDPSCISILSVCYFCSINVTRLISFNVERNQSRHVYRAKVTDGKDADAAWIFELRIEIRSLPCGLCRCVPHLV